MYRNCWLKTGSLDVCMGFYLDFNIQWSYPGGQFTLMAFLNIYLTSRAGTSIAVTEYRVARLMTLPGY